ncbi:synaptopodin 2-like protein [Liolophura sinensis]|uniref:synaptopodin 2-like protein n=1 Tax=Liolophura sinensis TaxID=3198878 RepID=UPI0031599355
MNQQAGNFFGSIGEEQRSGWDEDQSSSSSSSSYHRDAEEQWTPPPSPPSPILIIPNTPTPPPPDGEGRNRRPCTCLRCMGRGAGWRAGVGRGNYGNRVREMEITTTTTPPANNNNPPEIPRLTQTRMERFTAPRAPVGRGIGRGLPRQLNLNSAESSNPGRVSSPSLSSLPSPIPTTTPPRSPGWVTARRGRARARLDSERGSSRPTARVSPQPRDTSRNRREDENRLSSPLAQALPSTPAREVGVVRAHPNLPLHTAELDNNNYLTSEERDSLVRNVEERLRAQPPLQWFLIPAGVSGLPLTTNPPEATPPPAAPPAAPPATPPIAPGPGAG